MVTATPAALMPRVRWSWLSNPKADIAWNLFPFWVGYAFLALLFAGRNLGGASDNPVLNFTLAGRPVHLAVVIFFLYGPLVDAPHLWATIARTYTDREEWAARRRLFLWSFAWFAIGPAVILLPYAIGAIVPLPPGAASVGWIAWGHFFTFYALFHVNKQHWGFVSLYKRKNADLASPLENKVDQLFFMTAIWIPYAAMLSAPWYRDFDGTPLAFFQAPIAGTSVAGIVHPLCHAAFFCLCAGYVAFQVSQARRGVARNGPKLVYIATVIPLHYLAFSIHPFVAAFWVIITGLGHCAQYHRVVWTYGQSKYVAKAAETKNVTRAIFGSVWLYAVLGLAFGLLTLQGPGAPFAREAVGHLFQSNRGFLAGLDDSASFALGVKVAAAFIGGVRLHHFYVDSKIWKVSKSATLAKNMNV